VSVAPGIKQVTLTPESFSSARKANERVDEGLSRFANRLICPRHESSDRTGKQNPSRAASAHIAADLVNQVNCSGHDAVGAEAHATSSFDALLDKTKASVFLATDRAHVLREAIWCCRKGGTISVPGVYIGFTDKIPSGHP
jgi:hypothetical protein